MTSLAIVGSRTIIEPSCLYEAVDEFFEWFPHLSLLSIDRVISGGAAGVDSLAEHWANRHGLGLLVVKADWDEYGRAAGPIRNQTIVDLADYVLAVWDGESRGTADTIRKAKEAGKPLHLYLV